MKNINWLAMLIALGLSGMLFVQASSAAISAEEAKQLGTTLTKFGAEKASNEDGSIPAYTGGIEKVTGYDPKTSDHYVNPFADEKPLYSVSAENMQEYADMLTEGTKELMGLHPDYRIDVYPTHRSMRYQDWVIENTMKNATTVQLAGKIEGDAVTGADKNNLPFPGVPFPIPKNGYEVMWNFQMHFGPAVSRFHGNGFLVDTAGNKISLPSANSWHVKPWYDKANNLRSMTQNAFRGWNSTMIAPPSSAGTVFLIMYLASGDQNTWFYTPGQRRVRRAPEFAYDVPISAYGGVLMWDELFGFTGRMNRFDFKLVGKKEMLVPYNAFKMLSDMLPKDFIGPKFVNPDALRWEKHRIWVVEATRKPEARHVYLRKTFYIDEDSWDVLVSEGYDNTGNIWRIMQLPTFPAYDTGGIYSWSSISYDILKGNYSLLNMFGDPGCDIRSYDTSVGQRLPLTPASVAASSVR
ncbi:hypothetical protein DSCO28_26400 [Desulfosarcina ovata subsp. sediminis]|uniref:DUF1329 domain-containing protein n=1 Tax=Desulfosarcina ovata subsp. sediminis TaxID=885957 RepID=A0A5K7ZL18_9BACT|nr:DUF1329 domain-containing protein [Desulfosarcina ovata]BBO82074.1 hypothetical protein DSCO28_26400 [Desulfosarcina ovata subsp. sediminis]